jgi:hypothetical protein
MAALLIAEEPELRVAAIDVGSGKKTRSTCARAGEEEEEDENEQDLEGGSFSTSLRLFLCCTSMSCW